MGLVCTSLHAFDYCLKVKNIIIDLKVGDPLLEETQIGPLAKPEFVNEVDELVKTKYQFDWEWLRSKIKK